ncbi:hypothetical protein AB4Y42_07925 [Paraburkholderia sp. EG286B]|uniref:hypothetical protein n=1 Tax=Paraburkholderia sp. EG286B TaxID=3237011 RepID=UPI0034D2907E
MAVNFSLLRPEEPVPVKLPPRFLWTVIFSVIRTIGDFMILLLWPKVEPPALAFFAELDTFARSLPLICWNPAHVFETRRDPLRPLTTATNRKDTDKPVLARRIGELQAELIQLDPARALAIA